MCQALGASNRPQSANNKGSCTEEPDEAKRFASRPAEGVPAVARPTDRSAVGPLASARAAEPRRFNYMNNHGRTKQKQRRQHNGQRRKRLAYNVLVALCSTIWSAKMLQSAPDSPLDSV